MKYLIDTDWIIDHLNGIPILGIEKEVCKIFGKERGRLRKDGGIIGDNDDQVNRISNVCDTFREKFVGWTLLGHDRLTTTGPFLNLSPEDAIREFLNKW